MKNTLTWILPLLLAAAIAASPLLSRTGGGGEDTAADVLRAMEAGDPDAVQDVIRQQQKARMEDQREEIRRSLLSGETDIWSMFRDYLIVGDSRAYGFSYNGFLPEDRVLADVGDTVLDLEEHIPEIAAMRPARLYISYGMNEFDNQAVWPTGQSYADSLEKILGEVEEALPGVEIYVNSFMEVLESGQYEGGNWDDFDSWNDTVREMCHKHGYTFVDNAKIAAEHHDLYYEDGVHFAPEFYDYWAANLIMATYYPEEEQTVDTADTLDPGGADEPAGAEEENVG